MTANQIAYQKLLVDRKAQQEVARHNLASEGETYRSNVVREVETNRHNTAVESWNRDTLFESSRHNLATEQETERSHKASEYEANRSNVARERENYRHNYVVELETKRSNVERETETKRSNIERETETKRHNIATEGLEQGKINLGYSQLNETATHNRMTEQLEAQRHAETARHNKASERQEDTRIQEEQFLNIARAAEMRSSSILKKAQAANEQGYYNTNYTPRFKFGDERVTPALALAESQVRERLQNARSSRIGAEESKARTDYTNIQADWYPITGLGNAAKALLPLVK